MEKQGRKTSKRKRSERDYIIEEVLDERIDEGVKQYLLKYKGYPDFYWIDESDYDCPDLIQTFEKKKRKKHE